jgi:hypothetical protein
MAESAYCTILARNYLPSALTLAASLRRHASPHPLSVLLIDTPDLSTLPEVPGVRWMSPMSLGLPQRTVLELAMSYDLVEFATAIKPLLLDRLLEEHPQVFYLDPDTYQVSEMRELGPALAGGAGILLTPHYLDPAPADGAFTEGHLLNVGVYNLGFCGVDRRARGFLAWWWEHLREECLHDPLAGLFVDQKWMDVGSVLFSATCLRHRGYNVSVSNLHERPIDADRDGYRVGPDGDRLRLFHFHAFKPERPEALYTRASTAGAAPVPMSDALRRLATQYAAEVIDHRALAGPQPAYLYATDTTGRPIPRRLRHAYRVAVRHAPESVPSPFLPQEATAFARWRRQARRLSAELILSDLAKGMRCALPEEYGLLKARFPALTGALRRRMVEDSGMWR